MKFKVHALDDKGFADWVAKAKTGAMLDRATYLALTEKSENNPVAYYGQVEEGLFARAVNLCVIEGKMCQAEMMALDMKGGTGVATPLASLPARNPALAQAGFVTGICTIEELMAATVPQRSALPRTAPLTGHGLTLPGAPNNLATLSLSPSDL